MLKTFFSVIGIAGVKTIECVRRGLTTSTLIASLIGTITRYLRFISANPSTASTLMINIPHTTPQRESQLGSLCIPLEALHPRTSQQSDPRRYLSFRVRSQPIFNSRFMDSPAELCQSFQCGRSGGTYRHGLKAVVSYQRYQCPASFPKFPIVLDL